MNNFRDLVEANIGGITYDESLLNIAQGYHEDADAAFSKLMDELGEDGYDEMMSEDDGEGIPHNGDFLCNDDADSFYRNRKIKEIKAFLKSVKIDGKPIRKIDFDNWENYEAELENPIEGNTFYKLDDGSGVLFTFGIDTGDRWGVITAVGLV